MFRKLTGMAALVVALLAGSVTSAEEAKADAKVRVLILDGQNNHNWKATTPYLKQGLEGSGRFVVEVATGPAKLKGPVKPKDDNDAAAQAKYKEALAKFKEEEPAYKAALAKFRPDLTQCDVVLSNYNGDVWSPEFQKDLEDALKAGKVGLVVFHAANNAFTGWPEFNRMIGMGWRVNSFGERIYFNGEGKEVRQKKGEGLGAGETSAHPFRVTVRDAEHPVMKGMPAEWMHTADQLVHGLRGPIENVHVLATAYSDKAKKGTGEHELMIWTVSYGKGRVFHTPMGHDLVALRCVGLTTTILRGTEWAATGKVTLPVPASFPTGEKTSVVSEK